MRIAAIAALAAAAVAVTIQWRRKTYWDQQAYQGD